MSIKFYGLFCHNELPCVAYLGEESVDIGKEFAIQERAEFHFKYCRSYHHTEYVSILAVVGIDKILTYNFL